MGGKYGLKLSCRRCMLVGNLYAGHKRGPPLRSSWNRASGSRLCRHLVAGGLSPGRLNGFRSARAVVAGGVALSRVSPLAGCWRSPRAYSSNVSASPFSMNLRSAAEIFARERSPKARNTARHCLGCVQRVLHRPDFDYGDVDRHAPHDDRGRCGGDAALAGVRRSRPRHGSGGR